jgi:hypothetical protein
MVKHKNVYYLIASTIEKDEVTQDSLYWNNDEGWVDITSATKFIAPDFISGYLPKGSKLVKVTE